LETWLITLFWTVRGFKHIRPARATGFFGISALCFWREHIVGVCFAYSPFLLSLLWD
jgi:hypothetical protein